MEPDRRAFVLAKLAVGSPLRAAYLDVRRRGWTPLMQAVLDGDEEAVMRAIADGVDVDAIAEGATSALMLACRAGHEGIVARLLAAGADPDVRTIEETTLLHYAASHATSLVRRLLDAGAPLATDRNGMSPLVAAIECERLDNLVLLLDGKLRYGWEEDAFEYACARGRIAAMRLLCERFGDQLARSSNKPLIAAVLGDQPAAVRFVLDAGAAIDEFDLKEERSALMHAAGAGHFEVAELLLARGADPNRQTEWFVTAPRLAIQRRDARMFALLRAHGADEPEPPADYEMSIVQGARMRQEEWHARLAAALATDDVIAVAELADRLGPALVEAAKVGAVHSTAYLLGCGARAEEGRWGPLMLAIAASAGHVVRMLLTAWPVQLTPEIAEAAVEQADPWLLADLLAAGMSADRGTFNHKLIDVAAEAGRWRHVELLLEHGAALDDDINGDCPLARAAAAGHVRCVEILAAREPAGRVVKTESGYPRPYTGMRRLDYALLKAAKHPRTIAVLLRHGADPLARMADGESLLHVGAWGAASVALHLRLAGRYLDAPGRIGWTPLHGAVMAGAPEVLAELLGAGARVEARDPDGRTPLHIAATYPRAGVVDALLAAGADPHARDHEGRTPLVCAEASVAAGDDDGRHAATVERLREA